MAETKTADNATKTAKAPFLRGEGSMKGVTIVATVYDNAVREPVERENGEMSKGGAFIKNELARFDNANDKVGPQFEPALHYERKTDPDTGKTWDNKSSFYTADSVEAMREASGANSQPIFRHVDGKQTDERIGEVLVFDADLRYGKDGGMFCPAEGIKPTAINVPKDIQGAQFAAVTGDRKVLRENMAEKNAAKEAAKTVDEPAAEKPEAKKEAAGPDY